MKDLGQLIETYFLINLPMAIVYEGYGTVD